MKKITKFKIMSLLASMVSVLSGVACAKTLPRVSPVTAHQEVTQKKAVLLDVREREEVQEGMAVPAEWLAKSSVDSNGVALQDFFKKHPAPQQIIVYCKSGRRSEAVGLILNEKGYSVRNMGGIDDWTAAQLPTRQGP